MLFEILTIERLGRTWRRFFYFVLLWFQVWHIYCLCSCTQSFTSKFILTSCQVKSLKSEFSFLDAKIYFSYFFLWDGGHTMKHPRFCILFYCLSFLNRICNFLPHYLRKLKLLIRFICLSTKRMSKAADYRAV